MKTRFRSTALVATLFLLFPATPSRLAEACEPSVEKLARDALATAGASSFECPASLRATDPGEKSICAIVDGDVAEFLERWNALMGRYETEESRTGAEGKSGRDRGYDIDRSSLTLRVRGGAVGIACGPRAASETGDTEPDVSPSDRPATAEDVPATPQETPRSLHDVVSDAVSVTGASVFDCPDSMYETYPDKGIVCGFYEGTPDDFQKAFSLPPDSATPLADWSGSGGARERDYRIPAGSLTVRINNGAVGVAYDRDQETD